MTADDWCETMEMPKLGCAHCRPAAERRRLAHLDAELRLSGGNTAPPRTVRTRAFSAVTVARYPGRCMAGSCVAGTRGYFEPGDEIVKLEEGWAHHECAQAI